MFEKFLKMFKHSQKNKVKLLIVKRASMTEIDKTKKMLAGLGLTEKELEDVRDACDMLAEIIVDGWFEKRKKELNDKRRKK